MHSGSEAGAYSYYNVTEDSSTLGGDLYGNDLLISNAHLGCCLGSEVNMTLRSDNALGKLELLTVLGVNKLAGTAALDVTRLANGSGNADRTGIGKRNLNLAGISCRAKDRRLKRALGADYEKLLGTGILTGLAKLLLISKLIALTKEMINCLAAEMNVSCRGFNNNLFHFNLLNIN